MKPLLSQPAPAAPEEAAAGSSQALYRAYVNPQWVKLLNVLQMNREYTRCSGAELFTADGRRILDFLSGYCVHNTGHNHPQIVAALQEELARSGAGMLQSHVPDLAGQLAEELCTRAGDHLRKAFFCSSGSEGVETVIKFARAHTGRSGLLYARGAFHGLTCGALSLMGNPFWREGFGPLLPGAEEIPFGNVSALEEKLAGRRFAALVLEPVQAEAGICIPSREYLISAQALCRKYGTVFALDEVQTGLGRTGKFLAAHHFGVQPDMVILAKALSGGLVPSGAVLMTDAIFASVYDSLQRAIVHTSTFSENALAMRAGLATLQVLDREQLALRALVMGEYLRRRLREVLSGYEMVKEIRGLGLLSGIEFTAPRQMRLRVAFEAFRKIHGGLFGQMLVMRLFTDKQILTQICGNNFLVLKVAPPLLVTEPQADEFVAAVRDVVETVHSSGAFWSDALGLARRALGA
ncbi:MAG TPA: aspartate aminotransferase family protein [Terriglobales bacterium]|nr:aspartate aminotransferase family protein [Terriglobales bacterium]